jgi:ribonuclease HI
MGAANVFVNGIGAVLVSPQGSHLPIAVKLRFACTNNVTEYESFFIGLQASLDLGIRDIEVYGDSTLIICRAVGEWKTGGEPQRLPYGEYLEELIIRFRKITFSYMPKTKNQFADALARLASMVRISEERDIHLIKVEVREEPAYCAFAEEELDGKPWYHDIRVLIKERKSPVGATDNDKKTIRRLSMQFFLSNDTLYKRSYDSMLLRCVDTGEANRLMAEVHSSDCGAHMNGFMLSRKILRMGYYWFTMEHDCAKYVMSAVPVVCR